ncbi:MAG: MBL fold metallo-hydrolase [Anaerolineaceae bacterium]|nr:MBL fold metallo-hydrolase [Anaerolineaceae bacterium]
MAQYISGGDYILVTHAHYDHIMDVPPAAEKTGAVVLGSANTCALLEICGLPPERLQTICAGDRVELGPFQVEVFSSQHIRMPAIYRPGPLRALLRPPLRLRDYRMDVSFSFRIEVDGLHILLWGGQDVDGAQPADVLLTYFMSNPSFYRELMRKVRPALAVPLHWDNLFRPLTRPLRPSWRPPRLGFPMWLRARPQEFARMVARSSVRAQVLIPTIFQSYDFAAIVRRNEEGNGAEKALDGG